MKHLVLFSLITLGCLAGCKKEDVPIVKTENPARATITNNLVVDTSIIYSYSNLEAGNKFYASKNGKITKLGCQMRSTGTYVVSLWNFATSSLISATSINVMDTVNFFYNNISPVYITANTKYVVSMYIPAGKLYNIYFKKPTLGGPTIYPFTTGSITFEDRREITGISTSTFPTNVNALFGILGIADFEFEYSE